MGNRKKNKFLFSVVIPVYNVEDYLKETVESIVSQSIGFEKNVEIILVDDGSTDKSPDICKSYQLKYPHNIKFIRQKNQGPAVARDKGASVANGKYLSLPDSDDKLSENTLEKVYEFFEEYYDEIDVVSIPWEFFEARTGRDHPLNDKFFSSRVVDLEENFTDIVGSVAPSFFKKEVFQNHKSDKRVGKYSEDLRFMGEVLLDKKKVGLVHEATYFYRKRASQTSSQDKNKTDKFWYLDTPKTTLMSLIKYTEKTNGSIPKFIQYMIMYDLQWRYRMETQSTLNVDELKTYKKLLKDILEYIDDDVVFLQKNITSEYKMHILSIKYGENVIAASERIEDSWAYQYNGFNVYDMTKRKPKIFIQLFDVIGEKLVIEGFCGGFLMGDASIELLVNKTDTWSVKMTRQPNNIVRSLGEEIYNRNTFKVEVPLDNLNSLQFYISDSRDKVKLSIKPMELSRFSSESFSYRVLFGRIFKLSENCFYVKQYNKGGHLKAELSRLHGLLKISDWYSIGYRITYFITRLVVQRPIWILTDRVSAADDSAEILYRYIKDSDKPVTSYFALDKKSSEYEALKKNYRSVVDFYSPIHKILFLHCSKSISSEAVDYVINPFGDKLNGVVDLYQFDFVFLQHGIIRDDISGWLNRYNKNIKMFVTSAEKEYKSIISGNYGYNKSVVKLTGLPRYDMFKNDPKNKVILTPTWRENLVGKSDRVTGRREYNPNFKHSDYYKFMQGIMHSTRLQKAMAEYEIDGEFYLHPSFIGQREDFSHVGRFTIMDFPFDYKKMKKEGSLMVTDYSSVAFDFAYLGKPVIYTQFDENTFYNSHTSKRGYLSYEKDGLGVVVYDLNSTVDAIVRSIQDGFRNEDKYKNRVKKFFKYHDKNNSERVYNIIAAMDESK